MNRLFNKRKKSPGPSHSGTFTRIPTNVPAGPASCQADSNIGPEGGQTQSFMSGSGGRSTDIVVALDERSSEGSRIVSWDRMDEDQELLASGAWTSGVVIGGTEHGYNPTSECFRSL